MLIHKFKILGSESFTRWLVWGASTQELGKSESFSISTAYKRIKLNFLNLLVVLECPHYLTLSAPLKLHSFSTKMTIPRHLPKFWGKKPKATTKVTLTSH